ncbi:hypothetical protein [Streptomyces sp. H27-C3]|uniref:hypothetical protein n=1 Tax=Streptomyces sp. H27-C3 TaxID=3046305 RepID=UPI0024BAC90A|nr:hypothetical protein [Streptomyces sp. H27-C3]MDJ0463085.1 hypothetical protein [Streptomyces sp. H27-C3]
MDAWEREVEIIRLFRETDWTYTNIAQFVGTQTATVRRVINRLGVVDLVKRRRRPQVRLEERQIKQIAKKYTAGTSTLALAREYGVNQATINRKLSGRGIQLRSQVEASHLIQGSRTQRKAMPRPHDVRFTALADDLGVEEEKLRALLLKHKFAIYNI